jgi:hypothetical protein
MEEFQEELVKDRTRAYTRFARRKAIARKTYIALHVMYYGKDYVDCRVKGRFAKGKVHCSCSSCSPKRRLHGPRFSEVKALLRFDQQE